MNTPGDIFLPPEWFPQSGVLLTWPHKESDWSDLLDEVEGCFVQLANEILKSEKLVVVCQDPVAVTRKLDGTLTGNLITVQVDSNDTWARDHGPVTVFNGDTPVLLDFQFNGWGLKFPAFKDNQISSRMFYLHHFKNDVRYANRLNFVLEGGSFEVDGEGTLLTTEKCLLSINRNQHMSKSEIEAYLMKEFNIQRVLWLISGYLAGDDTDSHIDTLARFCDANTIAYVKCDDPSDEHFEQLNRMELELMAFRKADGLPYKLVALPMADYVEDELGYRLPATYANFLIINDKILMPCYSTAKDAIALRVLQEIFPDRQVVGIECSVLIKQHGSLHCVTMQFPKGVL